VRSKLHFTRCGISQIHERRTVSGALVKPRGISIGITLSLPPPLSVTLSLRIHSAAAPFGRSFPVPRAAGSSRRNYRLLRGRAGGAREGDIRFRRVRASGAVY